MKETFRKYLDKSFHRKFSIRKGHDEMRVSLTPECRTDAANLWVATGYG